MIQKENRRRIYQRIQEEIGQGHPVRQSLYRALEARLGRRYRVVSFFTSFQYPVVIENADADMLEEVLNSSDLGRKHLVLLLNSPGGDPLAAERIVNICKSYSTGGFSVIVPKMAKSAATMICLGAKLIWMSRTSELGPIDPQILINDEKGRPLRYQAAHEILDSYEELMEKANTTNGRLEPYLQQLARFDARDIRYIQSAQGLSEHIALTLLKKGMLRSKSAEDIKKKIKRLIDPKETIDHARPIYGTDAQACGLKIRRCSNSSPLWQTVWQLYARLDFVVNSRASKIIESSADSWTVSA
jgi:ClpP class serine protease